VAAVRLVTTREVEVRVAWRANPRGLKSVRTKPKSQGRKAISKKNLRASGGWRRATNEANLHGSFTFVGGLAASWDVGDQPVPAQTVGASGDDLRLAERRGQESLPFPVLPGYRPMHCLEGLLSGGRTANRTIVYIHTLASPAARAIRVPGRLEPGCGFDPNFSGDRRPRRTD